MQGIYNLEANTSRHCDDCGEPTLHVTLTTRFIDGVERKGALLYCLERDCWHVSFEAGKNEVWLIR